MTILDAIVQFVLPLVLIGLGILTLHVYRGPHPRYPQRARRRRRMGVLFLVVGGWMALVFWSLRHAGTPRSLGFLAFSLGGLLIGLALLGAFAVQDLILSLRELEREVEGSIAEATRTVQQHLPGRTQSGAEN